MPEFEEENGSKSQSQTYTPSRDASEKPRTRRRSGGFKTEAASIGNPKIGEVDPVQALKEEKLSGPSSASGPRSERSDKSARQERADKPARGERAERAPRQNRESRAPRESHAPRSDANPQPSPETLAAIASVEAKIAERRAGRDASRGGRNSNSANSANRANRANREERSERPSAPRSTEKPAVARAAKGGLISAIGGFLGKLFGNEPKPAKKKSRPRNEGPQERTEDRGSERRRTPGGQGKGGSRGGQGRKRGSQGPRRNDRRKNETAS